MRSKPVSQSSPETGDAPRDEDADAAKEPVKGPAAKEPAAKERSSSVKDVKVELEVSRNRYAGWTVFGLVFGALLIWKLGTVGQWVGVVLMVLGALRAWQLLQTFLHPPGTIVVGDDEVVLPRGLCLPRPIKVPSKDVTAVYFLRRSVPWNRSAPVLVVELGGRAFAFPRDWFASEADQRHVVHALLRGIEGAKAPPDKSRERGARSSAEGAAEVSDAPHHDDGRTIMWAQLVGGLVLLGGGIGAWSMASTPISNAQYALFVTPIVAGWIFAWRGLMRW
jgi:hypothetical protein